MSKKLSQVLEASGVRLKESDSGKGVWEIRVIEAGEGSSGFYPAEVLERDGAKAFPKGTRMFANHDGWEDMFSGGDIRRLMGKTTTDATYRDGALWAEAKFHGDWVEWMTEFNEQIGVSINTVGESEFGTIGEYSGDIVTALENDPYTSVDVVVAPGAGGRVTRMLENAKRIVEDGVEKKNSSEPSVEVMKENEVELKEMKEALAESNTALVTALVEALKPSAPAEGEVDFAAVAETVVKESSLTASARTRIFESVKSGMKVEDAIASEKKIADEYEAKFKENKAVDSNGRVVTEDANEDNYSMREAFGIKVGA
jgi:hypothetical protein